MDERATRQRDWLAERFEADRSRLRAVAYRMLGSPSEADDAVQEAWLRLNRTDPSSVENLSGWLTTVVARVSLDMLRSRSSRREESLEARFDEPSPAADGADPEHQALLADSVGPALLVVLDTLAPAERLAFVLHDLFAVPFEEIAPIVGRSSAAARQLASRARRRVQGADSDSAQLAGNARKREVVNAFLTASRTGDFTALLALLDPDVVLRADGAAVRAGSLAEVVGASAVAETFSGRAKHAELALVDGMPGLVWAPGGKPRIVFDFSIMDGMIVGIELLADAEVLDHLDWQPLLS
jgi:RNA polymerase sigma-70 factor (ECF subfamily)